MINPKLTAMAEEGARKAAGGAAVADCFKLTGGDHGFVLSVEKTSYSNTLDSVKPADVIRDATQGEGSLMVNANHVEIGFGTAENTTHMFFTMVVHST